MFIPELTTLCRQTLQMTEMRTSGLSRSIYMATENLTYLFITCHETTDDRYEFNGYASLYPRR